MGIFGKKEQKNMIYIFNGATQVVEVHVKYLHFGWALRHGWHDLIVFITKFGY